MKEAKILYAFRCHSFSYYFCEFINSHGHPIYGLCPSKEVYEVGARAPIGFIKQGKEYKMYIKKGVVAL